MEFIGAVDNLSYKPIAGYNQFLKGSAAFDVQGEESFESVLNKQIAKTDANPVGSLFGRIENAFGSGLNYVNDAKKESEHLQEVFATGGDVSAHDLMIAAEKSSLAMNMALQVRNKVLSAYTELQQVKV